MKGRIDKICMTCSKGFKVLLCHSTRKFCSLSCVTISTNRSRKGKARPSGVTRIEKICDNCHKTFSVLPSYDYRKYCNQKCSSVGIGRKRVGTRMPPRSTEHTRKQRESLLKYLETGSKKFTNTGPELIVKGFLEALMLDFKHPKTISPYSVDFYLTELNTIIEVDGCWWHACPIHCSYSLKGESIREKNRVREQNLKQMGFKVIRIWEHDIIKSNNYKEILGVLR